MYAALPASAEHAFFPFLSSLHGMEEHLMQYYQPVGSPKTPLGILIQEKLQIHSSFWLTKRDSHLPGPLFSHLALLDASPIVQFQKGQVTREIIKIRIHPTTAMESLQSYFMSTP